MVICVTDNFGKTPYLNGDTVFFYIRMGFIDMKSLTASIQGRQGKECALTTSEYLDHYAPVFYGDATRLPVHELVAMHGLKDPFWHTKYGSRILQLRNNRRLRDRCGRKLADELMRQT